MDVSQHVYPFMSLKLCFFQFLVIMNKAARKQNFFVLLFGESKCSYLVLELLGHKAGVCLTL